MYSTVKKVTEAKPAEQFIFPPQFPRVCRIGKVFGEAIRGQERSEKE